MSTTDETATKGLKRTAEGKTHKGHRQGQVGRSNGGVDPEQHGQSGAQRVGMVGTGHGTGGGSKAHVGVGTPTGEQDGGNRSTIGGGDHQGGEPPKRGNKRATHKPRRGRTYPQLQGGKGRARGQGSHVGLGTSVGTRGCSALSTTTSRGQSFGNLTKGKSSKGRNSQEGGQSKGWTRRSEVAGRGSQCMVNR
jgi:hypothetical protein